MNNIFITGKGIIYNEKIFNYSNINEILKETPKNINIVITEENILIKVYKENIKNIKELIDEDFFSGNGVLIDNYYDKKSKKLILYGIRSRNIKIFYKKNIKGIIPIQKLVSDYLIKLNKVNSLKFIFEFNDKLYFGRIEDGVLIEGRLLNNRADITNENIELNQIKEVILKIKNKKILMS